MTKIKFNQSIVGTLAGGSFSFAPGDEADIETPLASAWIQSGIASPVGKPKPETAVRQSAPETAVIKNVATPSAEAATVPKVEDTKKGE